MYFTKEIKLKIKKDFKNETYDFIEEECIKMWEDFVQPFDIQNFKKELVISNLKNTNFHNFIKFKELILNTNKEEGLNKKLIDSLKNKSYSFTIISENYESLQSNESNFKIVNADNEVYIITKDEINEYQFKVYL